MDESKPVLLVSDTQMPYENENALKFCAYLKRHYGIPDDNCMHVGDESDQFHGGQYPKGADYPHTPRQELAITKHKFQEWAAVFPKLKIAISNHGLRWVRKASGAEIPSQLLADYKKIMGAPEGWVWRDKWVVGFKHPFVVTHGMELSGKTPYRTAAEIGTMSHAFGHLHTSAGIAHVVTQDKNIWGMNTGCLIDPEAYAFQYGKYNRFKPTLGAGIVFSRGSFPMWIPLESFYA